jgi:hypothetical protein
MDLYCWPHNTTHRLTAGEVEQAVYALTGMLFDARRDDADNDYAEYHPKLLPCPKESLMLARDSECYLEHTEQGVESRKAMTK